MASLQLGPRSLAILLFVLIGGAVTAVAVALSGSDRQHTPPALSLGPSYTEAVIGTWHQINPLLAETDVDRDLAKLLFRGLVSLGADGSVRPELADLPTIEDGGRQLTFTLRNGLRWSDGHELDSGDVAYTIRQLQSPDFRGNNLLAEAWSGVTVTTPDSHTVVVILPQPNAPFLARYATVGILPQHLLDKSSAQALSEEEFNVAPVGAGPYRLVGLSSEEARLVANPYFEGKAPGIVDLRLLFLPDQAAAIRALVVGEADGFLTLGPLDPDTRGALREEGDLQMLDIQPSLAVVLYLNNDNVLLELPEVRRALALAIDREVLPWGAGGESATTSASPVAPGSWAYVASFDDLTWDPPAAKALLEEQGWLVSGTSGVLTREGSEFRFTIRTDDDPLHVAIASALAGQLEEIGVRATVASTARAVLVRDFLQERKYSAALVSWEQGGDPDPYDGWHSSQLGSAGLNIANFADPVTDELIALGRTHNQPAVRRDAYRQLQARWIEMTPSVVLGYPSRTYLLREGIRPSLPSLLATPSQRFFDIESWRR